MAQTEPAPKHNYSGRSSGTAMEGAQFLRYGEASKRLESAVLNHVSLGFCPRFINYLSGEGLLLRALHVRTCISWADLH